MILDSVTFPLRVAIIVAGFQFGLNQSVALRDARAEPLGDFFFVVYLLLIYVAVHRLTPGLARWYGK